MNPYREKLESEPLTETLREILKEHNYKKAEQDKQEDIKLAKEAIFKIKELGEAAAKEGRNNVMVFWCFEWAPGVKKNFWTRFNKYKQLSNGGRIVYDFCKQNGLNPFIKEHYDYRGALAIYIRW